MTKNFLLLLALVIVACGGKPVPEGYVKPSIRTSGPRMIMVEKPFLLNVLLYGDYPLEELGIEVTAGSRDVQVPFARGIIDVGRRRLYTYQIEFTHSFYWRLWYEHEGGMLGSGRLFRSMDAGCEGTSCPWDEVVIIQVRVRRLEILPGGGLQMGKDYARGQHNIRLDCYDCQTERVR